MTNRPRIGAEKVELPKVSKRVHVLGEDERKEFLRGAKIEAHAGSNVKASFMKRLNLKRTEEAHANLSSWMAMQMDKHERF